MEVVFWDVLVGKLFDSAVSDIDVPRGCSGGAWDADCFVCALETCGCDNEVEGADAFCC